MLKLVSSILGLFFPQNRVILLPIPLELGHPLLHLEGMGDLGKPLRVFEFPPLDSVLVVFLVSVDMTHDVFISHNPVLE